MKILDGSTYMLCLEQSNSQAQKVIWWSLNIEGSGGLRGIVSFFFFFTIIYCIDWNLMLLLEQNAFVGMNKHCWGNPSNSRKE